MRTGAHWDGSWGGGTPEQLALGEEREGGFGFQYGRPFVMQIDAQQDGYRIHVDSTGNSGATYGSGSGSNLEIGNIHNGVACDDQASGPGFMMCKCSTSLVGFR